MTDQPPPLTVSKKRDPLRDGSVFQAQPSPGSLAVWGPSPAAHPGSAGPLRAPAVPNSLLRGPAAEAAALNRSVEALQIKSSFEAMISASPLPQAFRQPLSPTGWQHPAGYGPGSMAPPFFRDLYQLPAQRGAAEPGPGLGSGQLGYGPAAAAAGAHAELLSAPSALYRSAVQQHRQQQQQQQAQAAAPAPAGFGGAAVETREFTRVVHSHSPNFQALVSSTVHVVRQSAPVPPHAAAPPAQGGAGRVLVEELPAGESQQQQQQSMPAPQPAAVLSPPLLTGSPAAAPRNVALAVPAVAVEVTAAVQQQQQQQQQQQLLGSKPASEVPSRSPVHTPSLLRSQGVADGAGPSGMQRALAQVGAMVRDLCSPEPGQEAQPRAGQEDRPQLAAVKEEDGGAGCAVQPSEAAERQRTSPAADLPSGRASRRGVLPSEPGPVLPQQQPLPQVKEEDQQPTAALGAAGEGKGGGSAAAAAAGGLALPPAAAAAVAEDAATKAPPLPAAAAAAAAAAASSNSSGPCSSKGKAGSKEGVKRRVKSDAAVHAAPRRHMSRREAATVQPILRSIGSEGDTLQTTRSGRVRMKPIPYWANARLVMDKDKDLLGVEQKPDLLGLSGPPPQRQQQRQPPSKAPAKSASAPPKPQAGKAKPQPASEAAPEQQQQQQQEAAQQRKRGRPPIAVPEAGAAVGEGKGDAQPKGGAEAESEAAQQEQQLGARVPAAVPSAAPTKKQRTAVDKAGTAPAAAKKSGGLLAAVAASAGARAAAELASKEAAAAPNPVAGGVRAQQQPAADGQAEPPEQSHPALPAVPGVPADVVAGLAQLPAKQRTKCGHCKPCLHPTLKKACLALRALREQEASEAPAAATEPAAAAAGGSRQQRQAAGAAGLPKQEPKQELARPGKAAGKKRAAGAAASEAPAAKKARRQPQQRAGRQQQRGRQQKVKEENLDEEALPSASEGSKGRVPATAAAAAAAAAAAVEEEAGEGGWTSGQVAALQRAWLQIPPTTQHFWREVAKQVPGKSASECYDRYMARHPTPPHPSRKSAPKKYLAAAKEGAHMPELKPGASKQVVQNAARKYVRQLQWQQRASKVQAAGDGEGLGEELLEEMEAAERKDRYIDQILRKRQGRPLGAGPRGRKAAQPAAAAAAARPAGGQAVAGAAAPRNKLRAADSEREVRAALAGLDEADREEERDSGEESDYYWSDA